MKKLAARIALLITFSLSPVFPSLFIDDDVLAGTDEVAWSTVKIPTEGVPGKWVLANGSDIQQLTQASDGTLYCYANPSGTTDTLFKSIDGGNTWTSTGKVRDAIIDIAILPQDANTIYYATTTTVYKSKDAGITSIPLPPNPGGACSSNIRITSIDVVSSTKGNLVAASTTDADAGHFGGVYLFDETQFSGTWLNTSIGNYDAYRIAFSPNYTADRQMIAIVSNEIDTIITGKMESMGWNQFYADARIPASVPVTAVIAFPDNYADRANFYIAMDTGTNRGDVYKITRTYAPGLSTATSLKIGTTDGLTGVDITGLAVAGNGTSVSLLAGCARSAKTYVSRDGGLTWIHSQKSPTGQSQTSVIMAPDFNTNQKAYAITCGTESAFSLSNDGGATWNQVSLIDSKLSRIIDVTVTAPPSQAPSLFMLTFNVSNSKQSLWRTNDYGNQWQRVFCSNLSGVDSLSLLSGDPQTVYVAGQSNGNPVVWKSVDFGQNFTLRYSPCVIDAWAIANSDTIFLAGFDGSKGLIYRSVNTGSFYTDPSETGTKNLYSIAISPDYQEDKTILVGNTTGQVFYSTDNGASFQPVGQVLPLTSGFGRVSVSFDHDFKENKIIYAATDSKVTTSSKERIFRFTLGQSSTWKSIYGSLPVDAVISKLMVTNDGILYAVNTQSVVAADNKGGILRVLTPSDPSTEIMTNGLDEAVTLTGLWAYQKQFWSIDKYNIELLTISDTLAIPITLNSPADQTSGIDTETRLEWSGPSEATEYEWQVSDRTSFTDLSAGFSGTSEGQSANVSNLKPATTYYWQVRVTNPFQGFWSETSSFTTVLGGTNVAPVLTQPEPGMQTPVKPAFQWGIIPGADAYELMISTDTGFTTPILNMTEEKALLANAWLCETNLEYDTTYFWKVRARTTDNFSAWSPVSTFCTEPAPATQLDGFGTKITQPTPTQQINVIMPQTQTPTIQPPATTTTIVQFNLPNWAIYSGLALLAIIILLIATILGLILKVNRH